MEQETGVHLLMSHQAVLLVLLTVRLLPLLGCRGEDGLEDLELLLVNSLVAVLIQHAESDLESGEGFDEDGEKEKILSVCNNSLVPETAEQVIRVVPHVRCRLCNTRHISSSEIPPLHSRLGFSLDDRLEKVLGSHVDLTSVLHTGKLYESLLPTGQLSPLRLLAARLQPQHLPCSGDGELVWVDDGVDEGGASKESRQSKCQSSGAVGQRLEPRDRGRQQRRGLVSLHRPRPQETQPASSGHLCPSPSPDLICNEAFKVEVLVLCFEINNVIAVYTTVSVCQLTT